MIPHSTIAERDRLSAEINELRPALEAAEQRIVEARAQVARLESRTGAAVVLTDGHPLRAADRALSAATNDRNALRDRLREATRSLAKLEATCSAPDRLAAADAELTAATAARTEIESALAEVVSKQAAMTAKDAELAARGAEVDAANAAAILAGRTPDLAAGASVEAERRAARAALAHLDAQVTHHRANLADVTDMQSAARDALREAQTVIARLGADAALRPILPTLVRAEIMAGTADPRRIEILVPQVVLDAVEASMVEPGV